MLSYFGSNMQELSTISQRMFINMFLTYLLMQSKRRREIQEDKRRREIQEEFYPSSCAHHWLPIKYYSTIWNPPITLRISIPTYYLACTWNMPVSLFSTIFNALWKKPQWIWSIYLNSAFSSIYLISALGSIYICQQ